MHSWANMMQCLEQDPHGASSRRIHSFGIQSMEATLLSMRDQFTLAPSCTSSEEGCSAEQRTIVVRRWSVQRDGCVLQTVACNCNTHCSGCCNTSCRSETSHSQLNDKSMTGTLILHAEASFIAAERGLRLGILSCTSLKHCIWFQLILSS